MTARLLRIAILLVCIFIARSAFAAGGLCPSGVPAKGNNCYFIAATGADTNSGTSESSPWLHAPGMPKCSNTCAGVTPSGGQGLIFRGGDTWHFGNSSATPYVGGLWRWLWNGSSGNNIYIGVDQSWYNSSSCGSSWCRPIMSGDNPLSTSTTLSGCAYQVPGGNNFVTFANRSYFTFDNFEFTGLCQKSTGSPFAQDVYISDGSANHALFKHIYFHGWTHVKFNCGSQCFNAFMFEGGQGGGKQIGLQYQYIVMDGSDSDPAGAGMFYTGMYDVSYSVFRYGAQMIGSLCHAFHDNLVEYWYDPGDGAAHGNVVECLGPEAPGTGAYYNNVVRHTNASGGQVNFWLEPGTSTTDYFFNNLFYDIGPAGNYFNIQNRGGGPVYAFNSTLQSSNSASLMECQGGPSLTHAYNMHFITEGSTFYNGRCSTATNLRQSNSAAKGQGYTATETYAYSPTSAGNSTVGTGTNEQSLCTALSGAGLSDAATACQSDTRYACVYKSTSHSVTCAARAVVARPTTAWDVGTFQYPGTQASLPSPPENIITWFSNQASQSLQQPHPN
jgi:hypothetical protein